jgi:hypothetical protein
MNESQEMFSNEAAKIWSKSEGIFKNLFEFLPKKEQGFRIVICGSARARWWG